MNNSIAAFSSLKHKALALVLALGLTCASSLSLTLGTPSAALASENATLSSEAAETVAQGSGATTLPGLNAPTLPLASKGTSSSSCAGDGDYSMTFYYIELVHYHDPELNHPSGLRLLHTHTVTGLNVGDQLDTWDYVADLEGYLFFDAIPARPVVGEDEALNGVELRYMNPELNEYTVDYYRVRDGSDHIDGDAEEVAPEISRGSDTNASNDRITEILGGQPVVFEKFKSVTVDCQPFNVKVHGDSLAHQIDNLMYLESYPSSIRVSTNAEDNVINLLYTDTMVSLPDDTEIPETPEEGSGPDNTPGNGGEGDGAPDNGNTPGDGSGSTPDGGDGSENAPDGGNTPGSGNGSESTPGEGNTPGSGNGPIDIPGSGADISGTPDDDPEGDAGDNAPGDDNETQPDTGLAPDAGDTTSPDEDAAGDETDSAGESSDTDGDEDTTIEAAEEEPAADATLPQTGDPLSAPTALATASAIFAAGALMVTRRQS